MIDIKEISKEYTRDNFIEMMANDRYENIGLKSGCPESYKLHSFYQVGKQYKVIEEQQNTYIIINDNNNKGKYLKSRFKPVELQKEYTVQEVLEMPKGTILKLFPYDESERRIIVAEGISENKYLYYIDDEDCHLEGVIISSWIMDKPRFRIAEEQLEHAQEKESINYEEEYNKLKSENGTLQGELEVTKECAKIFFKENEDLKIDNEKLRKANASNYDEYKESLQMLKEENRGLKVQLEEKDNSIAKFGESAAEEYIKTEKFVLELRKNYNAELEKVRKENEVLTAQLENELGRNRVLTEKYTNMESSLRYGEIKIKNEQIEKLNKSIEFKDTCFYEQVEIVKELEKEIKQLKDRINKYQESILNKQTKIEELKEQAEIAQKLETIIIGYKIALRVANNKISNLTTEKERAIKTLHDFRHLEVGLQGKNNFNVYSFKIYIK